MSNNDNMKYLFYAGLLGGGVYIFRNSLGGITDLLGTAVDTVDTAVTGVVSLTQNPNAGLTPDTFQLGKSATSTRALISSGIVGAGTLIKTKNVLYSLIGAGVADGLNILYDYSTQESAPASETTSGDIFSPTGVISNTFNNIGNAIGGNATHKGLDGKDVGTFGSRDDQINITPNFFGVVDNLNKVARLNDGIDKMEQYSYQSHFFPSGIKYYHYVDSEGHYNVCKSTDSTCGSDPPSVFAQPENEYRAFGPDNMPLIAWNPKTAWDNGIETVNNQKLRRYDVQCQKIKQGKFDGWSKNCGPPTLTHLKGKPVVYGKPREDTTSWYSLYVEP